MHPKTTTLSIYNSSKIITEGLITFTKDSDFVSMILREYGIEYDKIPLRQCSVECVLTRYKRWGLKNPDVYTTHVDFTSELHSHPGDEARVILQGTASVLIKFDELTIELNVVAGDMFTIPSNVVHSFSCTDKLEVIRYFEDGVDYTNIPYQP